MFRSDEEVLSGFISSRLMSGWFNEDETHARQLIEAGMREFFKIQGNGKIDGGRFEYYTNTLYQGLGFGRPYVVICDSPHQLIKEVRSYLEHTSYIWEDHHERLHRMFYHDHQEHQGLLRRKLHQELDGIASRLLNVRSIESATGRLSELYRLLVTPCLVQMMNPDINVFLEMNEVYRLMAKTLSIFCLLGRESSQYHHYSGRSYLAEARIPESLIYLMTNSFFFVPMVNICFIVRKPVVFDIQVPGIGVSNVSLHNDTGPVLGFSDDFEVYMYKGVQVSKYVIREPEKITVSEIVNERNVELRRVKLERYGFSRFMLDAGAMVVDEYKGNVEGLKGAKLYELGIGVMSTTLTERSHEVETFKMVSVVDCTPEEVLWEHEGTAIETSKYEYRTYFLRVPPTMRTAEEAVAWTWGDTPDNYRPIKET